MKASNVAAPKKLSRDRPDLEEAIEESDIEDPAAEKLTMQEEEEEMDISKDKYVKQPKKKAAPTKNSSKKASGKRGKAKGKDDKLDQTNSDEDVKPAKSRGKAKGKSKK
jgi:replication factor C subunit 1